MTEVITELTPEMEARIPVVRDEWIAIGRNTDPADRQRAEAGVREAYKSAGREPPEVIVWLDGVDQGITLAAQWVKADHPLLPGDPKLQPVTEEERMQAVQLACYGQHDAGWHSFYAFFEPYIPEEVAPLHGQREVARSANWWWPFETCCIITERPSEFNLDEDGKLHNLGGPAVVYRSGYVRYAFHGTCVPEWAMKEPHRITDKVLKRAAAEDEALHTALRALAPAAVALFGEFSATQEL